jgi:Ankyrin repeats (3 copies)
MRSPATFPLTKCRGHRRPHPTGGVTRKHPSTSSSEDDDFFEGRCSSMCKLMGTGSHDIDPIACDVNASDSYGRTALHYAAEQGHADLIEILLMTGSFVNSMDFEGMTPLYLASARGHMDAVTLLVRQSANVSFLLCLNFIRLFSVFYFRLT